MKIRDIQKSHIFRESVKKWGVQGSRHRVFVASPLDQAKEKEIEFVSNKNTTNQSIDDALYNIDHEIEKKRAEHDQLKSWIKERKSLRQDLKSMGFNDSWYNNKLNKTECEVRVHKLKNKKHEPRIFNPTVIASKKHRLSAAHVDMLPFLDVPLPIALAIIADYLQDNRLRLVDLFAHVDKNKDWKMTRSELKNSLKNSSISLNDSHLDELIIALDINNDDELSYKELANGIDAYHKDRRWQKLKKMYDDLVGENDNKDETKTAMATDGKNTNRFQALQLPRLDTRENMSESISQQRSRERRFQKQQKQKNRQRERTRSTLKPVKENITTTLSGPNGSSKVRYMHLMNEECARCLDICHAAGVYIDSIKLKKVLVPPYDNPSNVCKAYLSSNQSIFPYNHANNKEYRRLKQKELKSCCPDDDNFFSTNMKSKLSARGRGSTPLPRVASLDFKNRRKEAKKLRAQRECTSPTACWPQHLLEKLCLCMDDTGKGDGKSVLFAKIV